MGWSPYSMGMWSWYPGMGYTWISGEPWGWLPYHYGNWNFSPGFGWFWMPGESMAIFSGSGQLVFGTRMDWLGSTGTAGLDGTKY